MPSYPLVSVIMNCYNGERWLREAIGSVYAQTYPHWEIVFWDNASTDGSAEVARAYDSRLRYFRSEATTSLGAARNRAVAAAKGELLAFLDTDDIWTPTSLERRVELMSQGDYAACYGGHLSANENGRVVGKYIPSYPSGHIFEALLKQWDLSILTAMVRTSVLQESGLSFDPTIVASEEYCLFLQLAMDHKVGVLNEVLARYRVHDRALTNRSIDRWAYERVYTLDTICKRRPDLRARYNRAFDEAYARANYYRARYYMAKGNRRRAREELRKIRFVRPRYFVLYVLSLLHPQIWDWLHTMKTGRSAFSRDED